jgi:UDP-3-O-[3-hydroxymyristoyl] glucosamine N-acyltransferase
MSRLLKILFSIPKTIWFNFRYLPFHQAMRLPVWIASNTRIKQLHRGGIILCDEQVRLGLVHIGYHEADAVDSYGCHTILTVEKGGTLVFEADAHIGQGAILHVKKDASLVLGRHFAISGTTSVICNQRITMGEDVQCSWNSLITDGDAHCIYSEEGDWLNPPEEIRIGNKVWIAANTTILKGAMISDNTVIASNSLVNKKFTEGNCIIGGCPAKPLKHIGFFKI